MGKCYRCQADTELYYGGVPICVKCAGEPDANAAEPGKRQNGEAAARQAATV